MLKIIGAVLVTMSASAIGVNSALRLRTRAKNLALLISALEVMKSEICDRLTAMPELLELLEKEMGAPVNRFFHTCSEEMKNLGECSFSMIWRRSLEKSRELELRENEFQVLSDMGLLLGRYDTEEQKSGISYAIRRMESFQRAAEEERDKQGKLYTALGVCAGLFAVILLI